MQESSISMKGLACGVRDVNENSWTRHCLATSARPARARAAALPASAAAPRAPPIAEPLKKLRRDMRLAIGISDVTFVEHSLPTQVEMLTEVCKETGSSRLVVRGGALFNLPHRSRSGDARSTGTFYSWRA